MNQYTVSFFGHRVIEDPLLIEQRLEQLIRKLLKEKEYVEFLVGRNGDFDQLVSSVVRRAKREYRADNSSLVLVFPTSQRSAGTTKNPFWNIMMK